MNLDQVLEETCAKSGLEVPPAPKPVGSYRPLIVSGNLACLSGQISREARGKLITGRIGRELSLEEGKRAAQWALLQTLSLIRSEIGLDRVEQVLRLTGFVQAEADFSGHSEVMNAASDLLVSVLGEKGRHARTSVGVASLPLNAAVEVELTVKLR